jgi:hypothetical protein
VDGPQEEVIWAREAATTVEVTHVAAVHAVEAFARDAAAASESTADLAIEAEVQAALAEREAQERVLRMEADSATALTSAQGEAEMFTQRIALLEGELTEARQVQDMAEVRS